MAPTSSSRRSWRLMRNSMGRQKAEVGRRILASAGLLILQLGLGSFPAGAQAGPNGAPLIVRATPASSITRASRITQAPVLDGRDDDAVWRDAFAIADFRQVEPTEDGEPAFPTSARVDRLMIFSARIVPLDQRPVTSTSSPSLIRPDR